MEFRELYKPLLRWWWLIVAAAVVAGAFSLLAGSRQPNTFRSSTTIMIGRAMEDPNPSDYQLYTSQQLAATYADIAARQPVREATMEALGLDWLPEYVARPLPNTQLLEIAVTDTEPARAQAVANELATQLILKSPTGQAEDTARQEFINQQLDDLQVKIQQTQSEIDARQAELTNLTSARQIADTQNQIYALQSKLDTLRNNYTNLLSNTQGGALNTLTIIEPAVLPEWPIGPNVPMMVVTAVVFASAMAVGAVYLLAYLDNTIKSPEEIKRLVDLPMLIGVPTILGETYPEKLITARQPRSPIAEAFRSLRTAVQFSTIDRPESTALLVSSSNPSEGKSLTAANLGVVIAQAGHRVLIIDSDLRLPSQHKIFEADNHIGLTEFLRHIKVNELNESVDAWMDKAVQATPVEGLWLLTSGPIPPNPSELLGSNTYHLLLGALKQRFDFVVIDSPPVLIVTDSVVLSTQVDGTIIVIDADSTQKSQLRQAVERLREVNASILGVVVNRLTPKMDGYTSYYYYSRKNYYSGTYGHDHGSPNSNGKGKKAATKRRSERSSDIKSRQEG